jgi:hypothetical protein
MRVTLPTDPSVALLDGDPAARRIRGEAGNGRNG